MRVLAIILTIVGVSSAATIMTMDDKDLERVMMNPMYARYPSHPFVGLGTMMSTQRHQKEQDPALGEAEAGGEREARAAAAEEEDEQQREAVAYEAREAQGADEPRPPFNMFGNGMMAMIFPEMMFGGPSPYGASPYAPSRPNGNGHAVSSTTNGNGKGRPANGHPRPASNGHPRPASNGNGKRGGGSGSAAAASAASFSRGPFSFSSSQAQAFGGNFGQRS